MLARRVMKPLTGTTSGTPPIGARKKKVLGPCARPNTRFYTFTAQPEAYRAPLNHRNRFAISEGLLELGRIND
jgi:hypothetical protein